jgi:hypothetical protein
LDHVFDQLGDGAFVCCGFGDFGTRSQDTERGVDGDLLYGFGFGRGFGRGSGLGEVETGDLEAVEQEACAARVDVVGGDSLKNLADGGLDGGAVFGQRQLEGGTAAPASARVGDGPAGGVMVVTELFLAEAWTGATASIHEDVAALVLFRCFDVCVVHGYPPTGDFLRKVFEGKEMSPDLEVQAFSCFLVSRLNAEARLLAGPFQLPLILSNRPKLKCHFGPVYFSDAGD